MFYRTWISRSSQTPTRTHKRKEVAVLRDGPEVFGEMANIWKEGNATVQARTWTRIHQLYRGAFERAFQKYPEEKRQMDARIEKLKVFKKSRRKLLRYSRIGMVNGQTLRGIQIFLQMQQKVD